MSLALGFVVAGIVLLGGGGDLLVRGAVSLARLLRVRPVIIGLTIVAMGTSAPELAASLTAALRGSSDVAIGNVVGSNIINVALIVGLAAVVLPIAVHLSAVRLEWPVMLGFSAAGIAMAWDGTISRLDGAILLAGLVAFTGILIRAAQRGWAAPDAQVLTSEVDALTVRPVRHLVLLDVGLVLGGVVLLVIGAQLLVRGAVSIAQVAGLSERVIGLTIVAAGTSLPELATSLVAARRGQAEIALANVLGSNIFNLGAILGIVALVQPQAVAPEIGADLWWMLAYAIVLFPIMWTDMRITRLEGGLLLGSYGVYLGFLLL
ncbi:MAG TPA: calcium/sodium antiporter [Gemmatimonadales bacterium]